MLRFFPINSYLLQRIAPMGKFNNSYLKLKSHFLILKTCHRHTDRPCQFLSKRRRWSSRLRNKSVPASPIQPRHHRQRRLRPAISCKNRIGPDSSTHRSSGQGRGCGRWNSGHRYRLGKDRRSRLPGDLLAGR